MKDLLAPGRIKLRHLQCFLAVSQTASIQRAADALSLTQPAISKTLSELESIVASRLFERGRNGASLTYEGSLFAPYVHSSLLTLRDGMAALRQSQAGTPAMISVGILPTVAPTLLPMAIAELREIAPTTSVRIVTGTNGELLHQLKRADIDFAVGRIAEPEAMMGMSFEHLYKEPLAVVARTDHPLCSEANLSPGRLAEFPLVVPPLGTLIRQSAESVITAFGLGPDVVRFETVSVSMGRALALNNDAVWFVPSCAAQEDVARGLLVPLKMPFAGTDEPIGLLRRNDGGLNSVAQRFIDIVRNVGLDRR